MKNLRIIAACNNAAPLAPEGPLFDGGGYTIGSGSRLADSFGIQTSPAGASSTETPAGGTTTERGGGYTIGSGS